MPAPVSPTLWTALDRARAAFERDPFAPAPRFAAPVRLVAPAPGGAAGDASAPAGGLHALLRYLETRPDRLVLSSTGPRLRHAHRLPALADALDSHAEAVALWARLRRSPAASVVDRLCHPAWSPITRLHALWFIGAFEPPPSPWPLDGVRRVVDTARFRASIAERLAAGPGVPGAQAVANELAMLFERYAMLSPADRVQGDRVPAERPPRAA